MRTLPLALFATLAAATAAGGSHDVTPFRGGCGHAAAVNGTQWTGVLYGAGYPEGSPGTVTLRCSIHVGNSVHSGPAAAETQSAEGSGPVVAPPVTFAVTGSDVYVCDQVTIDGLAFYYDGEHWHTDPQTWCAAASSALPQK